MAYLQKLGIIKEQFKQDLIQILDSIPNNKMLVWEKKMITPLNMIIENTTLKEHGVARMFVIEDNGDIGSTPQDVESVVFLISSDATTVEHVARYLLNSSKFNTKKNAFIIFVPRKTVICENLLNDLQVMKKVKPSLMEFQLDILPFDNDLLVLDLPSCYKNFVLHSDISDLYAISRALMTVQCVFGIIPNIAGKGKAAKRVCDSILRMRHEYNIEDAAAMTPQIDNLILIDRSCDVLSPLIPQLNFEGLIDEVFDIKYSQIKLNLPKENGFEEKRVALNSSDEQFANLRDLHINSIGRHLSLLAKQISAKYDARHQATTIADLKEIVSQLPHMQTTKNSLAILTTITERLKEFTDTDEYMDFFECQLELVRGYDTDRAHPYIEECIAKEKDFRLVIRLICIQSFCNGGLKPKLMQYYVKEIVQVYNIDKLLTVQNLMHAGLLQEQAVGARNIYPSIKTTLNLVPEDFNEENPKDINYVCGGFAPISVRLIQNYTVPGWRSIKDVLEILPGGPWFEERQYHRGVHSPDGPIPPVFSTESKMNLVVFIGGATYSEISALRFLSQLDDFPAEYMVLTTNLLSPNTFIESLFDSTKLVPLNPFTA